ncbi:hypothetical protein BDZ45DRAFT_741248 [Acephala macrosclerotiorum]|nr:hypothetical protein BDZ45DRAFT_741248 [Acephala macrosclerotiorum]
MAPSDDEGDDYVHSDGSSADEDDRWANHGDDNDDHEYENDESSDPDSDTGSESHDSGSDSIDITNPISPEVDTPDPEPLDPEGSNTIYPPTITYPPVIIYPPTSNSSTIDPPIIQPPIIKPPGDPIDDISDPGTVTDSSDSSPSESDIVTPTPRKKTPPPKKKKRKYKPKPGPIPTTTNPYPYQPTSTYVPRPTPTPQTYTPVPPRTNNICGNPACGQSFICDADYNRAVQPLGYAGVNRNNPPVQQNFQCYNPCVPRRYC